MARHNRTGTGKDQAGFTYEVSYPPDWLSRVKVTRRLESGRQSTKVLFTNPRSSPVEAPAATVRVAVHSPEQGLHVEAALGPGPDGVREWRVEWTGQGGGERVALTFVPFGVRRRRS